MEVTIRLGAQSSVRDDRAGRWPSDANAHIRLKLIFKLILETIAAYCSEQAHFATGS